MPLYVPTSGGGVSDRPTTGIEMYDRNKVSSGVVGTSNQILRLSFFTAEWAASTTTQARVFCASAAGATPTLIVFALFTVDGAGDGAQVAVTANDTTLLASGNTAFTKSWTSSYNWVPNQRYAFGHLVVTAATAPLLCGIQAGAGSFNPGMAAAPRLGGTISSQATMPTSFLESALVATSNRTYAVFL